MTDIPHEALMELGMAPDPKALNRQWAYINLYNAFYRMGFDPEDFPGWTFNGLNQCSVTLNKMSHTSPDVLLRTDVKWVGDYQVFSSTYGKNVTVIPIAKALISADIYLVDREHLAKNPRPEPDPEFPEDWRHKLWRTPYIHFEGTVETRL